MLVSLLGKMEKLLKNWKKLYKKIEEKIEKNWKKLKKIE